MRRSTRLMAIAGLSATLIISCADSRREITPPAADLAASEPERNELQEILERGSLRVGTTGDFYLSSYDEESGARQGFDIDLVTRLAEDMGVEIEFVGTDWTSFVSGLAAGRYDLTTGASYTAARARSASYSIPIATTGTVALVRSADVQDFATWESINQPGIRVSVQHGGMVGEYAEDLVPDAVVQVVEAPGSAFEEVLAGRADVVLATVIDAAEHLERGSLLQPAPVEPQNAIFIGLLIPQGDSELRSFVDAWIRAQDCSGYLAELTAKYHLDF